METSIKKDKYSGYLWHSDQNHPETFQDHQVELTLTDEENPFVIEAQLCNEKRSYSIKYIDGHYLVKEYDLEALKTVEKTPQTYLPNFKAGKNQKAVSGLKFHQYWRPQADPLCADMAVLQPAEFVFVGFKYTEE